MATVEFDPQPLQAYANLEKAGAEALLDAIDDAIDALETNPGNAVVRRRSSATDYGAYRFATVARTG